MMEAQELLQRIQSPVKSALEDLGKNSPQAEESFCEDIPIETKPSEVHKSYCFYTKRQPYTDESEELMNKYKALQREVSKDRKLYNQLQEQLNELKRQFELSVLYDQIENKDFELKALESDFQVLEEQKQILENLDIQHEQEISKLTEQADQQYKIMEAEADLELQKQEKIFKEEIEIMIRDYENLLQQENIKNEQLQQSIAVLQNQLN